MPTFSERPFRGTGHRALGDGGRFHLIRANRRGAQVTPCGEAAPRYDEIARSLSAQADRSPLARRESAHRRGEGRLAGRFTTGAVVSRSGGRSHRGEPENPSPG
jgi:hypothetical protein